MKKEYKSKTFLSGLTEWEHFRAFLRDINVIKGLDLKHKSFEELVSFIFQYLFTVLKNEEQLILQKLIEAKYVSDKEELDALSRVTKFFSEVFTTEETQNESIDNILHDLSLESEIDISKLEPIKMLLFAIKTKSSLYQNEKREKKAKAGIMPYLNGFDTTVDLRGSFNKEFEIGEEIEKYKRELEIEKKMYPIISVNISLDAGTPDNFCFQASPDSIKLFINELQSALHRSEVLLSQINFK